MILKKKFYNQMKARREDLGVSQDDLAKSVSASRQTISYIETGTKTPNLMTAFEIAKALKMPVSDLFLQVPILPELLKDWDRDQLRQLWGELGLNPGDIGPEGTVNWDALEGLALEKTLLLAQKVGQHLGDIFEFNFEEKKTLKDMGISLE